SGTHLTQTGAILGTPAFMSPEQATNSKNVGPATDIYALGAILYQALTGRLPFEGASAFETLRRVVSEAPPSPRQLVPAAPAALEVICLKCLAKSPGNRYQTARELADAFRHFFQSVPY